MHPETITRPPVRHPESTAREDDPCPRELLRLLLRTSCARHEALARAGALASSINAQNGRGRDHGPYFGIKTRPETLLLGVASLRPGTGLVGAQQESNRQAKPALLGAGFPRLRDGWAATEGRKGGHRGPQGRPQRAARAATEGRPYSDVLEEVCRKFPRAKQGQVHWSQQVVGFQAPIIALVISLKPAPGLAGLPPLGNRVSGRAPGRELVAHSSGNARMSPTLANWPRGLVYTRVASVTVSVTVIVYSRFVSAP